MGLNGGYSRLVIQDCGTAMYHTGLAISEDKFGVLVHIHVLARVDLLHRVATLSYNHDSHSAVFVNDDPTDFWVGSFPPSCCLVFLEFHILSSGNL